VLAALARIYETAGYGVIGAASTARAARELGATAGIRAVTVHRLLSDLEESGPLGPRTVVLLDEAGSAPTRPSASLFAHAECAGAKVIAVGDAGQLPSVAAGGWFAALAERLGGPQLRQVMRQRDAAEREALEAVHDGDPEPYIELKTNRDELGIYEREGDALDAILSDWNQARQEHGISEAAMIARDNATREMLNDGARRLLLRHGELAGDGVVIADREYRVGDRVIARRNDRHRDIDNGTLGRVAAIHRRSGEVTVITDVGQRRIIDASYVAAHVEHAYALTGHGAHGATVEWAGVIGRSSEFTREWAYTSLSRARGRTRLYVVAEATPKQREREEYAPPEPQRTATEALEIMARSMHRREAEPLAIEVGEGHEFGAADQAPAVRVPLTELAEAGAEQASAGCKIQRPAIRGPAPSAWRPPGRDRGIER
jgi:ATP-dependent exoDNAse (exonuclease V) alpha subunit